MGTSGMIEVAMWIVMVPSVWNADAIAIRGNAAVSSAQVRISRGCASSNARLRATSSSSGSRVCKEAFPRSGPARVGRAYRSPFALADGASSPPFPYTGAARLLERPRAKPPGTTSEGVDTHG